MANFQIGKHFMLTRQAPDTIYWNPLVIHLVLLLIPFFLFHRDVGKGWLFHLCLTHVLVDVPREERDYFVLGFPDILLVSPSS